MCVPLCLTGAHVYGYDAIYQLTSATIPTLPQEAYSYDKVGNRKTSAQTEGPWSYNKNNELLSYNGAVFTYDPNGNTVAKTESGVTTTYNYGVTDRLTSVLLPDGRMAIYKYDPFGRRVSKQVGTQTTYFLYADEGLIGEYGANGNFSRGYGWRPNGIWGTAPFFMVESGAYYYYHNNHLGTPQKMTDVNGVVSWSATYGTFGDATVDPVSMIMSNLRFPGQYWDSETGLIYNWHRYYDPETARYTQSDPIGFAGGHLNLYEYAGNNSVGYIDPNGEAIYGNKRSDFLTPEKIEIISEIGPYDSFRIKSTPNVAETESETLRKKLGFTKQSKYGGEADALRHTIWLCEMAKLIGKEQALKVGNVHERRSPPPNLNRSPVGYKSVADWQKADSEMDLHNNKVGAELGSCKNKNVDCGKAAREALVKGKLIVNAVGGYVFDER